MPAQAIVALVGRPNVGKSSLFNRLVGERMAITDAIPGTTRDYLLGQTHWNGIDFTVIDTGGIELNTALIDSSKPFIAAIRAQALEAASQADCILFLVDAMSGLTAADEEIAQILRRTRAPVILVANKIDDETLLGAELEAYSLGLGDVFPISAIHSLGVGDLLDAICERLKPQSQSVNTDTSEQMHIAIIGRPNVGKSSLLNRLLGKERAIVSAHAGTTRDALDTQISWQKQPVTLIDTAGIRRRGKVTPGVEKYSVLRAKRAIDRSEVALLLMDAGQGVTEQDEHIAGMVKDAGCSLVLLVNKWDTIQRDTHTMHEMTLQIRAKLDFVPFAPILFISAWTGQRCSKVLETAFQVWQARFLRIQTAALNQLIRDALIQHSPPTRGNRRLKVRYAAQVSINPPLILFHVNDRRLLHFSYERYLENRIRAIYDFLGTPLRFSFREGAR